MKLINYLIAIPSIFLVLLLFSCTPVNEDGFIKNVGKYAVTLVDKDGNPIPVTKGTSTLPSGSRVSGTGYYANGDNCTLSYSPASGYNSTCSWDWHDGTLVQTANSSSATIRRDYKVTVTEAQNPKSYVLTLVASPTSGGSVSGSGTYNVGPVNIKANANWGYTFEGWYNGSSKLSASSSYNYSMPSTNSTLTARFKQENVTKNVTIYLLYQLQSNYHNAHYKVAAFESGSNYTETEITLPFEVTVYCGFDFQNSTNWSAKVGDKGNRGDSSNEIKYITIGLISPIGEKVANGITYNINNGGAIKYKWDSNSESL